MSKEEVVTLENVAEIFSKAREALKSGEPHEFRGFYNYCYRCKEVHLFDKETSPGCLSLMEKLLTAKTTNNQ